MSSWLHWILPILSGGITGVLVWSWGHRVGYQRGHDDGVVEGRIEELQCVIKHQEKITAGLDALVKE